MTPAQAAPDLTWLARPDEALAARQRRLLLWIGLLLLAAAGAIVGLVAYLQTFEREEAQRQLRADIVWMERALAFHMQRLVADLERLARQHVQAPPAPDTPAPAVGLPARAGALIRDPQAVPVHGWWGAAGASGELARWVDADRLTHDDNGAAIDAMLATARELGRPAYAGPMLDGHGQASDHLWVAVPYHEAGVYRGSYVAALALTPALEVMLPDWFRQQHVLGPWTSQAMAPPPADPPRGAAAPQGRALLDLPGSALALPVSPLAAQPPLLPRVFLLVALALLLGLVAALVALARGVRARWHTQRLLAAQVALRQAMEDALTTGLRAWDMEGRILYVNRAFCRMVGFDASELVGRRAPLPYWPQEQMDELAAVHAQLMRHGTAQQGVEVQFRHRDGHLLDVLVHESPLRDAHGRQIGWMSSVVDITERKRAERLDAQRHQRLQAMGRLVAVGEMASTLAHELNQPLGALSGFANGLLNRLRAQTIAPEEVVAVVERIERLAHKAGAIIQRVHAFARRREMARQPLELTAYLGPVLKPLARRCRVQWDIPADSEPLWVLADAALLEHAVRNVADNAADWAGRTEPPRPPCVRVALARTPREAGIVIADNGPGVPPAQRDEIFTAFYSLKEGGMGMGLAICRSVLEAHHGRLEVDRDPQLGGARFTLWLPRHPGADTPPAKDRHEHRSSG
jgi:two-component system sensor histidine kinase DctS